MYVFCVFLVSVVGQLRRSLTKRNLASAPRESPISSLFQHIYFATLHHFQSCQESKSLLDGSLDKLFPNTRRHPGTGYSRRAVVSYQRPANSWNPRACKLNRLSLILTSPSSNNHNLHPITVGVRLVIFMVRCS